MNGYPTVPQLVRGLRSLKRTQLEIAKATGIPRSTIRNLLLKKKPIRRPRIDTFVALAQYLEREGA